MPIIRKSVASSSSLAQIIGQKTPMLLLGSGTSTTIPWDRVERYWDQNQSLTTPLSILDLSPMPQKMTLKSSSHEPELEVEGSITWQMARSYLREQGLDLLMAPTEESASVLASLATSATGERSFAFGPLTHLVKKISFMNAWGEIENLNQDPLSSFGPFKQDKKGSELLAAYQQDERYKDFKNAPFMRLTKQNDLMIGSEGQLGAILKASLKVGPRQKSQHLLLLLPCWLDDLSWHLKIHQWVQKERKDVLACELMDERSLSFAPRELKPTSSGDLIYLELVEEKLEEVVERLIEETGFEASRILAIPESKVFALRGSIPRAINEWPKRHQSTKKGTDAQVEASKFALLLEYYKEVAKDLDKKQIAFALFGHFGDSHLHFNFLPKALEQDYCQERLLEFYQKVQEWQGSPFAEHGVGVLKQDFIQPFLRPYHKQMYYYLKEQFDPHNLFFPFGPLAKFGQREVN